MHVKRLITLITQKQGRVISLLPTNLAFLKERKSCSINANWTEKYSVQISTLYISSISTYLFHHFINAFRLKELSFKALRFLTFSSCSVNRDREEASRDLQHFQRTSPTWCWRPWSRAGREVWTGCWHSPPPLST